jgi:steroid delta-isomerase-like uncharacterized protein
LEGAALGDVQIGVEVYTRSTPIADSPRSERSKACRQQVPSGTRNCPSVRSGVFRCLKGTDVDKILSYYSDDVVIEIPTGRLQGKAAVRENFVGPFVSGFPGNVHAIRNLAHARNLVAVEWSFEAVHKGRFANIDATGKQVKVPGCSMYEYDLSARKITAGRIYFDLSTLLRQIGAAA